MEKGIGPSIAGLQSSLIGVLNIIGPLGCGVSLATVVDCCDVVMGMMPRSNEVIDLIGLLGGSQASLVFSVFIFESDDVWFWLSFVTHHMALNDAIWSFGYLM